MRYLLLVLIICPTTLMAQSAVQQSAVVDAVSPSYMMKLTGGLLLVVVLIFFIAWLLKRLNLTQQSQGGLIKIIAGLPMGTRDRIVLVQVGKEQILVGLSPGRMQKLHTLADPVVVDNSEQAPTSFAQKINDLMGKEKDSAL